MPIQQHERAANHALAEAALSQAVAEVKRTFGMTTAEICAALSVIQMRWAASQLSDERQSDS